MRTASNRRHLVLTTESARHPFRASLPPQVFALQAPQPGSERNWRLGRRDWQQFFTTYLAGFVAVTAFIS